MCSHKLLQSDAWWAICIHRFTYFDESLQESVKHHVHFVLVHRAEDEVGPLLSDLIPILFALSRVDVALVQVRIIMVLNDFCLFEHLVEKRKPQVCCIEPISELCVVDEDLP